MRSGVHRIARKFDGDFNLTVLMVWGFCRILMILHQSNDDPSDYNSLISRLGRNVKICFVVQTMQLSILDSGSFSLYSVYKWAVISVRNSHQSEPDALQPLNPINLVCTQLLYLPKGASHLRDLYDRTRVPNLYVIFRTHFAGFKRFNVRMRMMQYRSQLHHARAKGECIT